LSRPVLHLEVRPTRQLSGRFRPPGDKSITHRAYLLALLADGTTVVENANPGRDCTDTLRCAELLGLEGRERGWRSVFYGRGGTLVEPDRVLDCGNSGTTLRLLAGVLAGQPFFSVLEGDATLHRRPVGRIIEPLTRMGAALWARGGDALPPVAIRGGALHGIEHAVPVASAQVASCLLLAGVQAEGRTRVTLPGAARDHTERMLATAGVAVATESLPGGGRRIEVLGPARVAGGVFRVPGDFSSAAFLLAAAAALPDSEVTALGVLLNPTRAGLLECLEEMGAEVRRENVRAESGDEVGDVTVRGPERLRAIEVPAERVPRMIDEVPAWSVAAARAAGRSRLLGAQELRHKESDRLAMLAENLGRLGIAARELPEGLEIDGGTPAGGTVDAGGDHRIAMAFAALGTGARGPVRIEGAEYIDTSYPGFAATLAELGAPADLLQPAARPA
jgi:3-phosphoshikimate 1-carboxyvinyltransferase